MTSTYFNEDTFIQDCITFINGFQPWQDEFHQYLDNITRNNSIDDNSRIINICAGSIITAMKYYNDMYPNSIDIYNPEQYIYHELANVSLYYKYYNECEKFFNV